DPGPDLGPGWSGDPLCATSVRAGTPTRRPTCAKAPRWCTLPPTEEVAGATGGSAAWRSQRTVARVVPDANGETDLGRGGIAHAPWIQDAPRCRGLGRGRRAQPDGERRIRRRDPRKRQGPG